MALIYYCIYIHVLYSPLRLRERDEMFPEPQEPPTNSPTRTPYTNPTIQENLRRRALYETLENELVTLAGQINAANYLFIKKLAEFDENDGWHGEGIKSFSNYLNWKIGMSSVMAREKVRVARALRDLPLIDAAFSKGEVSYSKVRAMTRVATPENETYLMEKARNGTAAQMDLLVRKYELCRRLDEPDPREDWKRCKSLEWHQDESGMYVIKGQLPPEEGALVIKAIETHSDSLRKDRWKREELERQQDQVKVDSKNVPAGTFSRGMSRDDFLADRASALTHMAEHFLDRSCEGPSADASSAPSGSLGEKYQVFLHVNANPASTSYKIGHTDNCSIDNQRFISTAAARRLSCDASLTIVTEDDSGSVLNIGRRTRIIPRAMAHALRIRDGGCRFPGCTCAQRYTDAHHVRHWAEGGETRIDNLITLCRFHHGLLHRGEYRIHRDESAHFIFTNRRNEVMVQALYPQFSHPGTWAPEQLGLEHVDEHAAESAWGGERMDIQQAIACLYDATEGRSIRSRPPAPADTR